MEVKMLKTRCFKNGCFNDTISSTILFVLAYLLVLYISLSSTAFISFTNHLTLPIEIDRVNFDRAISGNDSVWESPENIFEIFSFSPLVVFIIGLIALILTRKFKKKALGVFLFWVVFHCILRFFGDFIFGHIFRLWSSNLVSDFMGLTYPNIYLKLFFITISLVATIFSSIILMPLINVFFNPIQNRADEGVKINLIIPSIIGTIIILLWFIPTFSINETCILGLAIIDIYILSRFIINRYKFVSFSGEFTTNNKYNIQLGIIPVIISIGILIPIKIFLTIGITLRSSDFRRDQLDGIFYSTLIFVLFLAFVLFLGYLIHTYKKEKKEKGSVSQANFDNIEEQQMDKKLLEGTKWSYQSDMSKKAERYNHKNNEE